MFGFYFTLGVVWCAHPTEERFSILSSLGLTCLLYFHTSSCCHSNPTQPSLTTCSDSNTSVRYSVSSDFYGCPNTRGDFGSSVWPSSGVQMCTQRCSCVWLLLSYLVVVSYTSSNWTCTKNHTSTIYLPVCIGVSSP